MRANLLCPTIAVVLLTGFTTTATANETIEGFTEPYRTVDISAGEPGIVTSIDVQPGQSVEAGEPLLALDTAVLEATLAVARQKSLSRGSVDAAIAELKLRDERLQQIIQLRQRGHATQRELSRAQTDLDIARARLQLAEEEQLLNELDCKRIEAQIARRQVSSPCRGIIAEVHREIGESLLVTDPRIMTLVQLDRLRTRFAATPEQAAKLRANQRVQVSFANSQQPPIDAVIERISPVVDAKSGTLEVHVIIPNSDNKLRSGSRCYLEMNNGKSRESYAAIPAQRSK